MLGAIEDGHLHPDQLVGRMVDLAAATGVLAALDEPTGTGMTVIRI